MIKHYAIKVTGEVQGVWYRKSTLQRAMELGIKGFVQNRPDWSVYIEAEGTEAQLREFIDWCAQGPEFAKVKDVNWEEKAVQSFETFTIQR